MTVKRQCNAMHWRFLCAIIEARKEGIPMYGQPMYQPYDQTAPYMQRLNQMQQPMQPVQPMQQPRDGLIRVTGMDGAKAYQLPPNSAVALFDGGQDVFYVKTTDGAGFPTIKAYAFAPMQEAAPQPATEYVTRQEFDQLKEAIINGKQLVQQPSADAGK